MLLSTAYFPNIQYLSKFFGTESIFIEAYEHYSKKSYRNRCDILAANGKMSLSIPIIKPKKPKSLSKEVKIDYKTDWQKQHFKSIESAYNSSPFYEYIMPDFLFVFEEKTEFLMELNSKILYKILDYIDPSLDFKLTSEYSDLNNQLDYRNILHPKPSLQQQDPYFKAEKYYQTFFDKFDFIENLSILDLLFNEGPRTADILKKSLLQ